ncbi:hypothetical protein BY996DRAFT_4584233 [Phakopsora pachyrhizi]|uniref:Expressed protein n=1 Tax=Phakopsora pachyrhizi TaxID=170000 RepID=A0AAV0BSJ7_PHAPC|nr:hypothetical protein BY996DRAFT_4584233 [Phakopsora pachyrhizi]CAH7689240.1 expressed protein [Phakopsora pachyrhizi]
MNFIHHSTQLQPDLNQQGEDESIRTFALEHTTQSIRSAHIISSQHNAEHNLQLFPTSNSALKFESEKLPSSSSPSTKIQLSFPSTSSPSLDPIASRPTPEITTVIQSNSQTPSNKSSTAVSKSRTRPITKCDRCRTRKCACDSHHPCSTCRTSGANCIYTEGKPIANGNSPLAISTKARKKRMITNSSSLKNERRRLDEKFGKLQLLLQDAAISASLQSHPSGSASSLALIEVDLEVDNLVTHFSKLWLREEPDLSFFRSSHPTLVRVRQYDLPRWRLSQTWATWSDHPAAGPEQQVTRFDRSFLPLRAECRSHCKRFFMHCDWYFELLTQSEINAAAEEVYHFNELDINPETPAQWTRIALALAICRLSLACLDWITTAETERISRKRGEKILRWCDLSVLALKCAGFDQNPTVDGIRVLVILLSTIFFETDYGLMGCSPPMLRLRRVAMDVAYRLNLNRDPERNFSSKEKDDRRRMWWSLVVIDSHFYATGASTDGVIRLQASDVRLPEFRQVNSTERGGYEAFQPLDLRSARTRFELGRLNNRCCQLFSQKRPLATMADIWSLDKEIVELEKRVPVDQRLSVDGKRVLSPQNLPVHNQIKVDEALWNGQQIFYIAIWHIRSKIHRGLLYTNQTSEAAQRGINLPMHRDIVKNGSLLLLDLYSHTKLPTAFVSAIASATLTLTLELIERPSDDDNLEIQKKVLECYSRLKTNPSPIITRACQVLDYFLMAIPSRLGTVLPNGLRGLAGWRQMSEKDVSKGKNF